MYSQALGGGPAPTNDIAASPEMPFYSIPGRIVTGIAGFLLTPSVVSPMEHIPWLCQEER